jgi:hypothetical protein
MRVSALSLVRPEELYLSGALATTCCVFLQISLFITSTLLIGSRLRSIPPLRRWVNIRQEERRAGVKEARTPKFYQSAQAWKQGSVDQQDAMDGLTDKASVFIPAKLLSYMTGIEFGPAPRLQIHHVIFHISEKRGPHRS